MYTLSNIIKFLQMVSDQFDGIWVNDYLNKDTYNGKMFWYCYAAKLIEIDVRVDDEEDGYPEEYAVLSDLGQELVNLKADLDVCVARLTGIEKQRQKDLQEVAGVKISDTWIDRQIEQNNNL